MKEKVNNIGLCFYVDSFVKCPVLVIRRTPLPDNETLVYYAEIRDQPDSNLKH